MTREDRCLALAATRPPGSLVGSSLREFVKRLNCA